MTLDLDERPLHSLLKKDTTTSRPVLHFRLDFRASYHKGRGQILAQNDQQLILAQKAHSISGIKREIESVTTKDEYVYHAQAAIALLRDRPKTKDISIFVLGHSFGGTMAARVVEMEPSVAGLIILAGSSTLLYCAVTRQFEYLNTLHDKKYHVPRTVIDTTITQAKLIDSPRLSLSTPSSKLPLGIPASYWLDLRNYDPVATAAVLAKPMFVLQGGRDYQVTFDDDFALWKLGLLGQGHETVRFRVYKDMNHLFVGGEG